MPSIYNGGCGGDDVEFVAPLFQKGGEDYIEVMYCMHKCEGPGWAQTHIGVFT